MKRRYLAIAGGVISLSFSACSTVQDRRAEAPAFEGVTKKTLDQFQGCFANQFDGMEAFPSYLPKEKGGTYTMRVTPMSSYVSWVLDIADEGDQRRATLYAKGSMFGKDGESIRQVQACL